MMLDIHQQLDCLSCFLLLLALLLLLFPFGGYQLLQAGLALCYHSQGIVCLLQKHGGFILSQAPPAGQGDIGLPTLQLHILGFCCRTAKWTSTMSASFLLF